MLTTEQQYEIIKATHDGVPVYCCNKMSLDHFDWKLLGVNHQFDFESNTYCIGEPLTFEETLAQNPPNIAYRMTIDYLSNRDPFFRIGVKDKNIAGKVVDKYEVTRLSSSYKLWNIAIQYGSKSPIIKPLTEEQGNFDIEFF